MTNEELNTKVYEKLFDEQQKYKEWLLTQSPEEILNHAYEYTVCEDIVLAMEYHDLSDEQTKALLSSPAPLDEIFHDFEQIEGDHMDVIRGCIETRANDIIEDQRKALLQLPVYPQTAAYAREHGELETYRASHRANVDCKNAIEDAISAHYKDNRLNMACLKEVTGRFGLDRTAHVVANTIRDKDWDGRISDENKAWAKSVDILPDKSAWGGDHTREFIISQTHPGLINLFANHVRKEVQQLQEKKPSVLQKLQEVKTADLKKSPQKQMEAEI